MVLILKKFTGDFGVFVLGAYDWWIVRGFVGFRFILNFLFCGFLVFHGFGDSMVSVFMGIIYVFSLPYPASIFGFNFVLFQLFTGGIKTL